MRILITGHDGYVGAVMAPLLQAAGHELVGLDNHYFDGCDFGAYTPRLRVIRCDIRDLTPAHLQGIDAVAHLAAVSNDPLGNLNPESTYDINHRASLRLAELAKAAGVERFIYSSSCSVYGAASPDDVLDESAGFSPVTPYARSKVLVERDLSALADARFCPVYMRNATVYGVSPRLRGDLVVNNLVGWALTTGKVLMKSDGTPWRPLLHVQDMSRAFLAALEAPRDAVFNQAFNVGRPGENYRIQQVAEIVAAQVPGSQIEFSSGAGPDPRCYRVSFDKLARALPRLELSWNVEQGVSELIAAYQQLRLTQEDLEGGKYLRIKTIAQHISAGRLGDDLRWTARPC
jgi:nucleoside-diphosphate-sugar epimerase